MKRIALAVVLAGAVACGDKREPPPASTSAPDPKNAVIHRGEYDEGPCDADAVERWPDKSYAEPTGASEFEIFAHGRHLHLARVGSSLFAHDFPHFFSLAAGKIRVLPTLPLPAGEHRWQVEAIAGTSAHLVVEIDEWRPRASPSALHTRLTLEHGAWRSETTGSSPWTYRLFTFADGRILDVREGDYLWVDTGKHADLDFGTAPSGCVHNYRYLDSAVVVGDTTWITGRTCGGPQREFVTHFGPHDDHASPFSIGPDGFINDHLAGAGSSIFVSGKCPDGPTINKACYAAVDEQGFHFFDGPRGFDIDAAAVDGRGALWVVVGASGDFNGRNWAKAGPAPVGEVHRRAPNDKGWERLAMPVDPLPGWEQRRFVAETVAADGDDVYVSGYFFYTQKPSPERVRTTRRFAILRLGHDPHPPIELDRKD